MSTFTPYITLNDYLTTIQDGQLTDQILDGLEGTTQRQFAEGWGIGKVRGLLKTRFDLDFELTPTLPYNPFKTYYGNDRVTIDFPSYEDGKMWAYGDCVIHLEKGYIRLSPTEEVETEWNADAWQFIGNKYDLWYIALPYPRFQVEIQVTKNTYTAGYYNIGDKVWWNNHIYTALRETSLLDHTEVIQYSSYNAIGGRNVFPDDKIEGKFYWKDEGEYYITSEYEGDGGGDDEDAQQTVFKLPYVATSGQEPSVWTLGDNRDPVMVQAIIDLSLYMLHKRISPRNIPELREKAKNDVFAWLRGVQKGDETIDADFLQPSQGDEIRWGSKPKNVNGYILIWIIAKIVTFTFIGG